MIMDMGHIVCKWLIQELRLEVEVVISIQLSDLKRLDHGVAGQKFLLDMPILRGRFHGPELQESLLLSVDMAFWTQLQLIHQLSLESLPLQLHSQQIIVPLLRPLHLLQLKQ